MLIHDELLAAVPDFISVGGLFKASPSQESGERFLYFEASNEDQDHQKEIVLQKALAESSEYYLRHGNIDLSHYTIMGPKSGIPNFMEYEIGKPVSVRVDGKQTLVKAQLYSGDSAMARNANMVWDSLTKQMPPSRWYASVGGAVLSKSIKIDPDSGEKVAVIDKVRWNNTALDRCPVNKTVAEVTTAPIGVFAKSLNGFVLKTLTAGYGTDSATLTGGGALRTQSLHGSPMGYMDFRDRLSASLRKKKGALGGARGISALASLEFGLSDDTATAWVARFLRDLDSESQRRNKS